MRAHLLGLLLSCLTCSTLLICNKLSLQRQLLAGGLRFQLAARVFSARSASAQRALSLRGEPEPCALLRGALPARRACVRERSHLWRSRFELRFSTDMVTLGLCIGDAGDGAGHVGGAAVYVAASRASLSAGRPLRQRLAQTRRRYHPPATTGSQSPGHPHDRAPTSYLVRKAFQKADRQPCMCRWACADS